jgi:hypothetical protein
VTDWGPALVVGGSGMLAGLSLRLLDRCTRVSVLARNEARIRAISPAIHPLVCDYSDESAVAGALAADARRHGAPELLVAWVHPKAPALRRRLAGAVAPGGRLVQVLGSAHGDPARPDRLEAMAEAAAGLPIAYQAIVLGFVVEAGRSRWLTNDEISDGVLARLEKGVPLDHVGTLSPWSARPGGGT